MKIRFVLAVALALCTAAAISCEKSGTPAPKLPENAVNLSAGGTANCYIVHPGTSTYFSAEYKGNSSSVSIGEVKSAAIVWQDSKNLITDLSYFEADRAICFSTQAGASGNAVVAAVGEDGRILWSWHLWVTDYNPEASLFTTKANEAGTVWTFMDRNLGATSMVRGSMESHGLLYQWGRKDAFPGAAAHTEQNDDYSYINDGEPEIYDGEGNLLSPVYELADTEGNLEKSIRNPYTFYKLYQVKTGETDEYGDEIVENVWKSKDWTEVSDDDLWGGESLKKTIYDPCPVGYKVPVSDAAGNTPYAWLVYADMKWDNENQCAEQEGQWFPTTGTRVNYTGGLDYGTLNQYSGLWFGTKGKASADLQANPALYGQYMFIINGKRTFKVNKDSRSQGMSLRCVKE